ncbi:MAG: hypothetical protein ABF273_07825 [Wenyingzhuangia sp.]
MLGGFILRVGDVQYDASENIPDIFVTLLTSQALILALKFEL